MIPEYDQDDFAVQHITLDDPDNAVVFVAPEGEKPVRVFYELGTLLDQFGSFAITQGLAAAMSTDNAERAYTLGIIETVQAIDRSYQGMVNEYDIRNTAVPNDLSSLL